MAPQPGGSGAGKSASPSGAPGVGQAQNAEAAQQKMAAVRDAVTQIAQQIKTVGERVPEFAPAAAQAIKALQQGMTLVAGNPERTPERQAPPNA